MAVWLSRHRKCGCDCRDADVYNPDTLVFNPQFDCGCAGGVKPPCKYLVRFECNVKNASNQNELIFEKDLPLRQTCEFNATIGQYHGLMNVPVQGSSAYGAFNIVEDFSNYPYGCTWSDRLYLQGSYFTDYIRWTLNTVAPVTFTHTTGLQYVLLDGIVWDCFGPNTLKVVESTIPPNQHGVQTYVCITPEITRHTIADGMCTNCYEMTVPTIQQGDSYIPAQRVEFMPINSFQDEYNPSNRYRYKGAIRLYAKHVGVGIDPDSTCFWGWFPPFAPKSDLVKVNLEIASPTANGQVSTAIIRVFYISQCFSGLRGQTVGTVECVYECSSFSCDGGTFSHSTNDPGFPQTLTLTPRKCYDEEVNDYMMTDDRSSVPGQGGCYGVQFDPDRPTYDDEYSRYHCCDPWGQTAPGSIVIYCPSRGTQRKDGCFETGGHTGVSSPKGPSREMCMTVTATDGTSHEICAVVYCNGGSAWASDWYCDGTYIGAGSGGYVSCCPHKMTATMPSMSCLPGCVGCLSVNTEPECQPVIPACCDPGDEPATLHVTFTSSCASLNGTSVLLTRTGAGQWELTTMGPVYILRCVSGTWTLTITYSAGIPCTITLTSTNPVCKPIMAGTFGTITTTCVAGLCGIGTTVSAELSP